MVLLIRPDEMSQLISMKDAIEAVEEGFRQWAELPGINAPRRRIHVPSGVRVSVHQGGVPGLGATGLMTHCEHVNIRRDSGRARCLVPTALVAAGRRAETPFRDNSFGCGSPTSKAISSPVSEL